MSIAHNVNKYESHSRKYWEVYMDWLTIFLLAVIAALIIFTFIIFRKHRNKRRLGLGSDVPIGNLADSSSSIGSDMESKFGGGSGGGAGTTRSFSATGPNTSIITANSIVNGEITGNMVSDEISENLLSSTNTISNFIEPTATIDSAANLLSTTANAEEIGATAFEFITDTAKNAVEVVGEVAGAVGEVAGAVGEVAGAVGEVAGEIVSEIISNS